MQSSKIHYNLRFVKNKMPKFAKSSKLPCNPTQEQINRFRQEYDQIEGNTTILSLDKSLELFFQNHLDQTAQIYSLAAHGTHAEFVLAHNKLIHQKQTESIKQLSNLSDYLIHKSRSLKQLENSLMNSLDNQFKLLVQNIQNAINQIQKNYREILENQFEQLKSEISEQLKIIKTNLDRLQNEFDAEILERRNLKSQEIFKFARITKEQSNGYGALFKILSNQTIKDLKNRKKPQENRQLFIDQQKMYKMSCHDLWCLMELIGIKKEQPAKKLECFLSQTQKMAELSKFEAQIDRDQVVNRFELRSFEIQRVIIDEISNSFKKSKSNQPTLNQSMVDGSLKEELNLFTDVIQKKPTKAIIKSVQKAIQKHIQTHNRDNKFQNFLDRIQTMKKTFATQIETRITQKLNESQQQKSQIFLPQIMTMIEEANKTSQQYIDSPLVEQEQQLNNDEQSIFNNENEQTDGNNIMNLFCDFINKSIEKSQSSLDQIQSISDNRQPDLNIIPEYKRHDQFQDQKDFYKQKNAPIYQHQFQPQQQSAHNYQRQNIKTQKTPWLTGMNDPERKIISQSYRQHRKKEQTPIFQIRGTTNYVQRKMRQLDSYLNMTEQEKERQRRAFMQYENEHQRKRQMDKSPIERRGLLSKNSDLMSPFIRKQSELNAHICTNLEQQILLTEEYLVNQSINNSLQDQRMSSKSEEPFPSYIQEIKPKQNITINPFDFIKVPKKPQQQEEQVANIQELLSGMIRMKTSCSIRDMNYNSLSDEEDQTLYDEDFQLTGRNFTRFQIKNKQSSKGKLTIMQVSLMAEQLHSTKDAFQIIVQVIKPVLLTFKIRDRTKNRPMVKLIVTDQTGIAVLYMNYYYEVKTGCFLKLDKCRLHNYCGSYQINYHRSISSENISPVYPRTHSLTGISLSLINRSNMNQLKYNVRCSYNQRLQDCIKELKKSVKIQKGEKYLNKAIIVTVCYKLENGGLIIGDYTGRIFANFSKLRSQIFINKNDTLIIKKAKLLINQGSVLLVPTNATKVTKADKGFKFYHDERFIPIKILKVTDY